MRIPTTRVYGPKQHGRKWRICFYSGPGTKPSYVAFETEEAAEAAAKEARRKLARGALVLDELVDLYKAHLQKQELAECSVDTMIQKIRGLLAGALDLPVCDITETRASSLYDKATERWPSAATHRNALGRVKAFWKWMRKAKHTKGDPWANVEGVGRVKTGKTQLTADESRVLLDYCLSNLSEEWALPVALTFILAMRVSEVVKLTSRNVDEGGCVVRVQRRSTKTDNGVRGLEVPPEFVDVLRQRAVEAGGGRLWLHGRQWLHRNVKRACKAAGVTVVCPHGLRGTHTTLARANGQTAHAVMSQLGHGSTKIQDRHYVAPGTVENAAVATVMGKLSGKEGQSLPIQRAKA